MNVMKKQILKSAGYLLAVLLTGMFALPVIAADQSEIDIWDSILKPEYFKDVEITEDKTIIELTTPYRAEDAAVTPVSITAKIPQTEERYIEKIYVFVDKNPQPLVGVFNMTPDLGKADLAMRIRVNEYTNVRVVAVLNTGEHHMAVNFVKAQGGCSAPLGADLKLAMERIGQMKFKEVGEGQEDGLAIGQYLLSHPNVTGLQLNQKTRLYAPEHYVKTIEILYNDKPLMVAETGFSISADPSFRFFFKPQQNGKMTARVIDSKGNEWTETFDTGA